MQALTAQLASKRLYIADLAARLEAMESGKTTLSPTAYRLYARRMKTAIAAYPVGLLSSQLGGSHPSVLQAIEQQHFEAEGMLSGRGSGRVLVEASTLLRRVRAAGR
ncbi:MAG: hypothetical protein ACXWUL_05315 [Caldimonas sp.]